MYVFCTYVSVSNIYRPLLFFSFLCLSFFFLPLNIWKKGLNISLYYRRQFKFIRRYIFSLDFHIQIYLSYHTLILIISSCKSCKIILMKKYIAHLKFMNLQVGLSLKSLKFEKIVIQTNQRKFNIYYIYIKIYFLNYI